MLAEGRASSKVGIRDCTRYERDARPPRGDIEVQAAQVETCLRGMYVTPLNDQPVPGMAGLAGFDVRDEDVACLSPLWHEHINMLGRYA